jgi:hypothetical protein
MSEENEEEVLETENFSELIKYTIPGYIIGLVLGISLDNLGYQRSPIGQWLVRTFAGEGGEYTRRCLFHSPET